MVVGVELEDDDLVFRAWTDPGQLVNKTPLASQVARCGRLAGADMDIEPNFAIMFLR